MDLCYIVYSKITAFKTRNVKEGSCPYNMINNNDPFPMLKFHALTGPFSMLLLSVYVHGNPAFMSCMVTLRVYPNMLSFS